MYKTVYRVAQSALVENETALLALAAHLPLAFPCGVTIIHYFTVGQVKKKSPWARCVLFAVSCWFVSRYYSNYTLLGWPRMSTTEEGDCVI